MATMNIERNARVQAGDGQVGTVKHVIVDHDTREVTNLVVDDHGNELLVPMSQVASVDKDRVLLRGSRQSVRAQSFNRDMYHPMDDEQARDQSRERGERAERGGAPLLDATDNAVEIGTKQAAVPPAPVRAETTAPPVAPRPAAAAEGGYHLTLREEHLNATTQRERAGEVQIGKRITEHTEAVDVPLQQERVVLERRPLEPRATDATIGENQTIEVPVQGERATVQKEQRVTEEVDVRKEAVQRTQQVQGTVRKEELTVDETPADVAQVVERDETGNRTSGKNPDRPRS